MNKDQKEPLKKVKTIRKAPLLDKSGDVMKPSRKTTPKRFKKKPSSK